MPETDWIATRLAEGCAGLPSRSKRRSSPLRSPCGVCQESHRALVLAQTFDGPNDTRNGLIAVLDHTGDVQKHTRQHAASQACLDAPYPVKCSPGLSSGYGGMAAPQAFHASWHAFLSFHQNSNSFFLVTEGCHQV